MSRPGYLAPFFVLAACSVVVLAGWWAGQPEAVQPRSHGVLLSATGALGLLLISLSPCLAGFGYLRIGLVAGLVASGLGLASLSPHLLGIDLRLERLLINHEALASGNPLAQVPLALALVCTLSGSLLAGLLVRPQSRFLPVVVGLLGSLVLAYALIALLASRNGLDQIDAWQNHARLGLPAAGLVGLLGGGLIWLAASLQPDESGTGPRWLWLPVSLCGVTLTLSFWFSLRERESNHLNDTTQLSTNSIAALFSREAEGHIETLRRFARRTATRRVTDEAAWEQDAAGLVRDFPGYRSIEFIDPHLRTHWFWPKEGHEDRKGFDHGSEPARRAAIMSAHRQGTQGIAAPIEHAHAPPTFAIYLPVGDDGAAHGSIAAEFSYGGFFDAIGRRLDLSERYGIVVSVERNGAGPGENSLLEVYRTSSGPDELDARLQRTSRYRFSEQTLVISLTPRPSLVTATRQHLSMLTLLSGVGVSLLLGLVIRLAQAAVRRQHAAESTAHQLRLENEERRRVEAQLKATDERLNLAFESTQAGVFEWDVESDQVYCTPSVWKMVGADPASMPATGAGWLALLRADERTMVQGIIDAHFSGNTPLIELEHRALPASGEPLWIALRAKCTSFTATGRPRRVLGTVQNINARKQADEALRSSQAETRKLSLVASRTDNAVVITDAQARIEWINGSFTRLTGRSLAEVAHRPLLEYFANAGDHSAIRAAIEAALVKGQPTSAEVAQIAADGRRFNLSLEIQPVLNDERRVDNVIAIATDITARVETEQQLRRAKEEADAASRSKSEFLASMSHEIRTPMNGVIGMTSLLLETELNPEQRDYVSTIRTSGDTLMSIINEILDFARIESGRMVLESQPFELSQCVEEAIDNFTAPAAAKNIELAYTIDPLVPACVLGDFVRLRQILVNLVNNAVKFTPRGFVTIEVGAVPLDPSSPAGGEVMIDFTITDSGIGIPMERQHILFQPFTQMDSSTTRKFGGTGLGLAICTRLSQLMGGGIDVQSTPGAGSRFHFNIRATTVPVMDASAPPLFPALPSAGPVLAVDDLPVNRTMLERCLRNWSLEPQLAATAGEALALLDSGHRFIAALIDQDPGTTSGVELVAQIHTRLPGLPIVLLTPAGVGLKKLDGASPLIVRLPKPIKPYALHAALRRALTDTTVPASVAGANGATGRLADAVPLDILLVEDNPVNRKVAHGYLARLGYQAVTATNGHDAVAAVKERGFDLVFMDLQMPEMDGLEAARAIRAECPANHQPIIVALTANAMQGDREHCLAAGMNDFLTKPLKTEDLHAAIHRHFVGKSN